MMASRYTLLLALVVFTGLLTACGNLASEPEIVSTQVPIMDLPQNQNHPKWA